MLRPELLRAGEIRAERARRARRGVMATVIQCQLLFWAWAFGWTLGPADLGGRELAAGALLTFAIGAAFSFPLLRRRVEEGVHEVVKLEEGGRARRVAFFDEYLTIGDEIVIRSSIDSATVLAGTLTLTYASALDGQPTVRELSGAPRALSIAEGELAPKEAS